MINCQSQLDPNDVSLLKELLEASENHNMKLQALTELLKQNNLAEKAKNQRLFEQVQEQKHLMEEKDSFIIQLKQQIYIMKQNEQNFRHQISELQQQLCAQGQQGQLCVQGQQSQPIQQLNKTKDQEKPLQLNISCINQTPLSQKQMTYIQQLYEQLNQSNEKSKSARYQPPPDQRQPQAQAQRPAKTPSHCQNADQSPNFLRNKSPNHSSAVSSIRVLQLSSNKARASTSPFKPVSASQQSVSAFGSQANPVSQVSQASCGNQVSQVSCGKTPRSQAHQLKDRMKCEAPNRSMRESLARARAEKENANFDRMSLDVNDTEEHQVITSYENINHKIQNFQNKKTILFNCKFAASSSSPRAKSEPADARLFEEFFLVGVPSSSPHASALLAEDAETRSVPSSVLFHFNNGCEQSQLAVISELVFPFGAECSRIRMSDSLSQLNEILFSNYVGESLQSVGGGCTDAPTSFVLGFQTDYTAQPRGCRNEVLQQVNPRHILYAVCYRFKDFTDATSSDKHEKKKGAACMYASQKVLCILTYFPFIRFFLQVITSALNAIKIRRVNYYTERAEGAASHLAEIDSAFFDQQIKELLGRVLLDLQAAPASSLCQQLRVQVENDVVSYEIPRGVRGAVEIDWGLECAITQFSIDQLIYIYLSVLTEQSIVFASKNLQLQTATVFLFFQSLLRPFAWNNPIIFNIPHSLIQMFDSPVPFIAGLNQDKAFVVSNDLGNTYKSCMFVFLGRDFEIINYNPLIDQSIDFFMRIKQRIKPYFQVFNEEDKYRQDGYISLSRTLRTVNPNLRPEDISAACFQLIEEMQKFVQEEIISFLPREPLYLQQNRKVLDYEKIAQATMQSMGTNEPFLERFFRTQMFSSFLEQKYQAQ